MTSRSDKHEIWKELEGDIGPSVAKVILSALGGVPVVGSLIGATGTAWSEYDQLRFQRVLKSWLLLQEEEMREIGQTIADVMVRVDRTDELVLNRMQSPSYLSLVRKSLRDWSAAESEEKRRYVSNMLVNAAAVEQLCSDDVLRMFIQWIDTYSESHFRIIREIHRSPGTTRYAMWHAIHGSWVREDSAEADMFKLLIHELTTGMLIRQYRETDKYGNYKRMRSSKAVKNAKILRSAFDSEKNYHLTELGEWFVHYAMHESLPQSDNMSVKQIQNTKRD